MPYNRFKENIITEYEILKAEQYAQTNLLRPKQLFAITSPSDSAYSEMLKKIDMIALRNVERLFTDLCERNGVEITTPFVENGRRFDLQAIIEGETRYIDFKTVNMANNPKFMDKIVGEVKQADHPVDFVFLIEDGTVAQDIVETYLQRINSDKVRVFLFEEYLYRVCGEQEWHEFESFIESFQNDMHAKLGYQVSELCNDKVLDDFKRETRIKLNDMFSPDYVNELLLKMKPKKKEVKTMSVEDFKVVNGKYKQTLTLLFSNRDFANSFITSEWLYTKYVSSDLLDNTYIVAGYLKSIEQLLWYIVSKRGRGRKISGKGRNETVVINARSITDDLINNTLGSLEIFLTRNKDLFSLSRYASTITLAIGEWRNNVRNGYFHKDNLNDLTVVEDVREKTILIYFFILGTIVS